MAGTLIPPIGLFAIKSNGRVDPGATLTVYTANSFNKVNLFSDSALTVAIANPIVANSFGHIPMFWVADGDYRLRLVTTENSVACDVMSAPAVGSSGSSGTGISTPQQWETGDLKPWMFNDYDGDDCVLCNGETIGPQSSGATGKAAAVCEDLYIKIYNQFPNTICAVTGGRGSSAVADWTAAKPIATPDLRGRAFFGLDTMGNSAASRLTISTIDVGDASTPGSSGGVESIGLTIAQLPVVTPAGTVTSTLNSGGNNIAYGNPDINYQGGATSAKGITGVLVPGSGITVTSTFAGTPFGSGAGHKNMPPFIMGNWLMRL
jgi:hypothetical protein